MYIPEHNKNEDWDEIRDFIRENSFGLLINAYEGQLMATHIPLELEIDAKGHEVLAGHMAKANPQWNGFSENQEVLCIFNGPHAYVSSSWYQKEEVPTWNYIAVHVYGKPKILNETETMTSLKRLVDKHERGSKNPVSLQNMSAKTLRQVKGIVGFQIEVTDIQAKYKLSQNREDDHERIVKELGERDDAGSRAISEYMKKP